MNRNALRSQEGVKSGRSRKLPINASARWVLGGVHIWGGGEDRRLWIESVLQGTLSSATHKYLFPCLADSNRRQWPPKIREKKESCPGLAVADPPLPPPSLYLPAHTHTHTHTECSSVNRWQLQLLWYHFPHHHVLLPRLVCRKSRLHWPRKICECLVRNKRV